jgi:rfaE bifunctional protein kinase chain/domain
VIQPTNTSDDAHPEGTIQRDRFREITDRYCGLRIAIVGDFCLDRYFEIDPAKNETSIETGLTVYNITRTRCQPGAAGTILNNLVALGVSEIFAVGVCGDDGEGWELRRALKARRGVNLDHFVSAPERKTFTYSKPLVLEPGKPPRELNRLDLKNWDATPPTVSGKLADSLVRLAAEVDAFILMDQVDLAETGVVTSSLLETVRRVARKNPDRVIVADSRRGLAGFPPVTFKMNNVELARLLGTTPAADVEGVARNCAELARRENHLVFVTMAEQGIVGSDPSGAAAHVPAFPVRGELDIVGAGDSVTANLTAALAAGAGFREAMALSMAAASIVIHQLGTTGTASVSQIEELLYSAPGL